MTRKAKTSSPASRADVHENVTNRIIKMLETAQATGAQQGE